MVLDGDMDGLKSAIKREMVSLAKCEEVEKAKKKQAKEQEEEKEKKDKKKQANQASNGHASVSTPTSVSASDGDEVKIHSLKDRYCF